MVDWFLILVPLIMLPLLLVLYIGCEVDSTGIGNFTVAVYVNWNPGRFDTLNYRVVLNVVDSRSHLIDIPPVIVRDPVIGDEARFYLDLRADTYEFSVQVIDDDDEDILLESTPCEHIVPVTGGLYLCFTSTDRLGVLECSPC